MPPQAAGQKKSFQTMQEMSGMSGMDHDHHKEVEVDNCIHSSYDDQAIRSYSGRPNGGVHNADIQLHLPNNHVYQGGRSLPAPPPPPQYQTINKSPLNLSSIPIPGINKDIAQDAHAKKQKEIRDLMKKRREKAVLVDRISRWLFPTSFILLNIVYWALFGDHDLW